MNLYSSTMTILFGTFAENGTVNSGLFGTIEAAALTAVGILKWAALLYVLVKIAILGFKIATQSKNSSDAITVVKEEGVALLIGLAIVLGAFVIHGGLKDALTLVNDTAKNQTGTVSTGKKDDIDTSGFGTLFGS